MANRHHSHYREDLKWDMYYKHNQMLCSGNRFVLARSNLRTYARLVVEYGRGLYLRRRLLAIFTGVKKNEDQQHAFLRPHLVEKPLVVHIARQIYYYETAMAMVATDLANLSDDDPDSAKAQRLSIYERWWERNGAAKELLASVNPLLARFNVRLVKEVETVNTHMYDHYLLVPTIEPYQPPLPPQQHILGTTILRWEELKERMLARKAELAKKWFKYLGQWETETYVAQNEWLASTNTQLKERQIVAYFPIVATIGRNVFWNVAFVPLVDYNELIGQHALSDRPYLRTPYLDVHPSIKPPEKAATPISAVTDNQARSGESDHASTSVNPTASSKTSMNSNKVAPSTPQQVQLSVTVPAGCGPGSQVPIIRPLGKQFVCVVPPNVYAGMQFIVNVTE
jgi:molybdopterin converting factor small subunit